MKILFTKCPVCGGELIEKTIEKLLRGGNNIASLKVKAEVCSHCGERLYSTATVKHFEEIRKKLLHKEKKGLKAIGKSFEAV